MFHYLPLLMLAWQDLPNLELKNAVVTHDTYKGSPAIKLVASDNPDDNGIGVIKGSRFKNGTIEMDVAGAPVKGAAEGARGFIGLNFRVQNNGHLEVFYIRPTNGRATDQLRRNHAMQYASHPEWPWERLRKETPGVYESYADMLPGEWTHLKAVVRGVEASFYVGGAAQPSLLVHDLKLGEVEGAVALWIGPGTEGHFKNISISEK